MKIKEYNQMMEYLTRPARDSLVKPKTTSTGNINSNKPTLPGAKSLAKHTAMMNRIKEDAKGKVPRVDFKLGESSVETLKKFPSIMPDPTSPTGFTGRTPEDDKLLKYIDGFEDKKYEPLKVYNRYDKTTYPSDPKQRKKLFSDTIKDPDIKRIAKRFVDPQPKKKIPTATTSAAPSLPIPNPILMMDIETINAEKERSRLAEEQFNKLTKPTYDPDLEKGLGYLMGVTNKENT